MVQWVTHRETAMSENTQTNLPQNQFAVYECYDGDEELAFSEPEAFLYLREIIEHPSFEELHRHFFKRKGFYYLR